MSRHSKRISVFDRLGPDNDRDSSSHHPPPPPLPHPPPVRHRHYPDKHGVPDDRQSRDKRESERIARKRRHGFDDDPMSSSPMESRPNKRDKPVLPNSRRSDPRERSYSEKSRRIRSSTSHSSTEGGDSDEDKRKSTGHSSSIKRSKSQRELGRRDRSVDDKMVETERKDGDYGHGDEDRSRRKRERESASEEEDHRENKRRKMDDIRRGTEDGIHHYHRDVPKSKERKDRKSVIEEMSQKRSGGRKRSLYDSFSESEAEHQGITEIDWFTLAKIPLPKLKEKKESVLDQFKAGPFLSKIGVSAALAGEELMSQVEDVITEYLMEKYGSSDTNDGPLFDVGAKHQLGSSLALHIEEQIANSSLISNIGPCRRALVASVDFNMRKKLRNLKKGDSVTSDILPSAGPPPSTWDPDLYSSSVSLYQSDNSQPMNVL